jgi:hypothetical protein
LEHFAARPRFRRYTIFPRGIRVSPSDALFRDCVGFNSVWEMSMNPKALFLAAAAALAFAAPAFAHHSFAMFDREKTITLKGTVKEYEWTNPHSWLRVMVVNSATGKPVQWAFEMSSPARQIKLGMTRDSVKPGDQITVTFHPMKDGTRGGQFIQAVLPDGRAIVRGERDREPPPVD